MCWCRVRTWRSCTNTQTQTQTCLTQTVASTQTVCLNTRVSSFAGLRGAAAQLHTSSANTCTWTQTRHGNINTYFFLSASERYTALFMFVFTNPPSPTSAQVYLGLRLCIKSQNISDMFFSLRRTWPLFQMFPSVFNVSESTPECQLSTVRAAPPTARTTSSPTASCSLQVHRRPVEETSQHFSMTISRCVTSVSNTSFC